MFEGLEDTERPSSTVLEHLAACPPGPAVMAELQRYDVTTLSPYDRVLLLKAWDRQQSWASLQMATARASWGE